MIRASPILTPLDFAMRVCPGPSQLTNWRFPKDRRLFFGVPLMRTVSCWDLDWGPYLWNPFQSQLMLDCLGGWLSIHALPRSQEALESTRCTDLQKPKKVCSNQGSTCSKLHALSSLQQVSVSKPWKYKPFPSGLAPIGHDRDSPCPRTILSPRLRNLKLNRMPILMHTWSKPGC